MNLLQFDPIKIIEDFNELYNNEEIGYFDSYDSKDHRLYYSRGKLINKKLGCVTPNNVVSMKLEDIISITKLSKVM